jgi:type 2 lantibiotic biosynthesis protein LanM
MQAKDRSPVPLPDRSHTPDLAGCLTVFAPMIHEARERVRRGAERLAARYGAVPFDPAAIEECLAANLAGPLLMMASRVLILELNVARLEGRLSGDTPKERFLSFAERLSDTEVSGQLLDEYSELRAQVANCLEKWTGFSLEFLEHACQDWAAIEGSVVGDAPGLIVGIEAGAGDTHRNGRSVMIATFSTGARVVYKPRSLAVDVHFQQLLAWLNECGAEPRFRILKYVNRSDHGWVEFVHAHPCGSPDEVSRFYQRQGGYLAILYALEASDFHCENLIAAGEHPVLIDLEALFHPRLNELKPKGAGEIAAADLCYSALRVGLLPVNFLPDDAGNGPDVSGLGSAAGKLSPEAVPCWEDAGTDSMRLVRKRVTMSGSANRPSVKGQEVDALDYAGQIAAGFESTYLLLLRHRAELKAKLAAFSNDEVRVIVRATQTYGRVLRESFHPDLLRDSRPRLEFLDRLREAVEFRPCLEPLISAEVEDLLRGDVPLFTTRPSSRHLWSSAHERIENYFEEPGGALVERRVEQLGERDLHRQLWIVRASLATMSNRAEGPPRDGGQSRNPAPSKVSTDELVVAACGIGDRLSELALRNGDDVAWLGVIPVNESEWRLSQLALDLYDGMPGVALFLAELGAISGEPRYTELARSAISTVRRYLKDDRLLEINGGFSGWGGILYGLTRLGQILHEPPLTDEAEALLEGLGELIPRDKSWDIIGGSAGCALALRSLHMCRPSSRIVDLARACGDHLLRNARNTGSGLGWLLNAEAKTPLTGFAHGSAGIGQALLAIAELTEEQRFAEAADGAFAYERSLFSAEHGNWPDLRAHASGGFAKAWCHGAPGIALSRLYALRHSATEALSEEIRVALSTTAQAVTGNHTLCHGDLGNADILLSASEVLLDPRWRTDADRIAANALATARESGWICGNPLGVESPGLMTGISGIGYALLRLAKPSRVPSILALEPARCCEGVL